MEKRLCPPEAAINGRSSYGNGGGAAGMAPRSIITRSEINACPTTFIQADTSSFKHVVQMLTGSSETTKQQGVKPADGPSPSRTPIKTAGPKKPAFKLHERRSGSFKNFNISPLMPGLHGSCAGAGFSPRKPEILSPSVLNFPSLALSPVTPLIPDPFNRSPPPTGDQAEEEQAQAQALAEERAIAEKGFYLHPSPTTTPRDSQPRLLPLFPVTSPKMSSPPGHSTTS